jgi:hypothetical protein
MNELDIQKGILEELKKLNDNLESIDETLQAAFKIGDYGGD